MSLYNSFDRSKHLEELTTPLLTQGEGVISAATRRARTMANLGTAISATQPNGRFRQAAPAAKTTTTTLTAAEIIGGLLTGNQGAAGAASYTLPTVANLEAALPSDWAADDAFEFTLINLSTVAAEDITVVTNTGWTLVGKMTVESNAAVTDDARGTFRARKTGASAWSLYRVA